MANSKDLEIASRNIPMDMLRVFACFLVIWQHSCGLYYIGNDGISFKTDIINIIAYIVPLSKVGVPVFVMISGYFLLPMRGGTRFFFKKRFVRLLLPFLFWCVVYAVSFLFAKGDSLSLFVKHIILIPINFGVQINHLWYVYMILGLYLITPVISPWLSSCSKKELQIYLIIWGITTLLPYIHLFTPSIFGECEWNQTPTLYYFAGYGGYFILGFYVKKYGHVSLLKSLILLFLGYVITVLVFNHRICFANNLSDLTLSFDCCSINMAFMSLGIFSLFQHVQVKCNFNKKIVSDYSIKSYAVYLAHILILKSIFFFLQKINCFPLVNIFILSIGTFVITYIVVILLSYLPKSKFWLGI